MDKMTLIKAIRVDKQLKQDYVSRKLKIKRTRLKAYENDKKSLPEELAMNLANFYNVSPYNIFNVEKRMVAKEAEIESINALMKNINNIEKELNDIFIRLQKEGIIKTTDEINNIYVLIYHVLLKIS